MYPRGGGSHMTDMGDVPSPSPWVPSNVRFWRRVSRPEGMSLCAQQPAWPAPRRLLPGATRTLHFSIVSESHALSHGNFARKVIHLLAWVRGRVNVMIDLVRHEFMGPSPPRLHFRSTAVITNTVLRTIQLFAVQSTRAELMVQPGQISTKVYPQSDVLPVCLEGFPLRSAGCTRRRWPEEPGLAARSGILHSVSLSFFQRNGTWYLLVARIDHD